MSNDKKNRWTIIINTILALLSAIATSLGISSCAGLI
ncbi:MAG: smalltalk protein [Bacteroidales bacterium]|nr:smalltalk protein [Candidatus Equimonas faecalis]